MMRMSRKPLVVMKAMRAPLRSSTALVAIVEPCTRSSIPDTGTVDSMMALNAPSSGFPGTDGTLAMVMAPSASIATRSVKVPPTSTPTRMTQSLAAGRRSVADECRLRRIGFKVGAVMGGTVIRLSTS